MRSTRNITNVRVKCQLVDREPIWPHPYESQRYREKGDITRSRMLLWWFYECWTRGLRHLVPSVTFIAACSVAALQIAHHQHQVGDFVVLITYWTQLTGPLATLAGELSRLTERLVNAEKLLVLLEKTPRTKMHWPLALQVSRRRC